MVQDIVQYGGRIQNVDYHAVEDNKQWHDMIEDKTNIEYKPGHNKYIESIYEYDFKFDVIVIDGVVRFDCIKPALEKIKDDGIIIFDNSRFSHKILKKN